MAQKVRVLSTKKLLSGQRQYLLNAGFSVIDADFIGIRYKDFELDNVGQRLIFTSSNAVRSVLRNHRNDQLRGLPCYCVGEKTKAMLETAGFNVVASAENATELAKEIRGHRDESFTFFAGNMRLETLPMSLKIAGVAFSEVEVYETVLLPHEIKASVDAVLFFSPSGVESFARLNSFDSKLCFCIGETTAKAARTRTDNLVIANKPSVENVIIQCIKYYGG